MDATNAGARDDLDTHVATFAPPGIPGVSHQPVVDPTGSTPANDVNSVVKVRSTIRGVEDSAAVLLEHA